MALDKADWASIFGNPLVIVAFAIGLVLWALIAALRLAAGVRRLNRALGVATERLERTPRQAAQFVSQYEATAAALQDAAVIGPAWRDWSATLITPSTANIPVRSTIRPSEYFSLNLLRACRINPRLHAAMPNLLVGVGLLLTFAGLSLALGAAGGIAAPGETAKRLEGLKGLLDVASAKFITSLVGLLCSLAYTAFRSGRLVVAERALDEFLAALEERIPLATSAGLQAEANAVLEKSLTVQTQFATEVAVNIGGRLDAALDQRLSEHIGPLREAIEHLAGNIGSKSEDTMRSLIDQFRDALQGGAQQHMEKLAATLAETSGAMGEIRQGLQEAATRMASAADQIAEQMGRNAEQAMERITLQMEGLVEQLRTLSEQSRAAGNDAMAQAAARIAEAGEAFGQSARAIASSLEQTVAGMTERLGGEAEAATRRMTEELTRATAAMRDVAEQNRTAGDAATQAMAERIAQAAAGFERSAAQVAEVLQSGAGDAAGRLTAAVEELRDHFSRLASDLAGNMQQAGSHIVQQGRDGAAALTEAAQTAAESLRVGGRDGGEALRTGGSDAGREILAAGGALDTPARDLAQRLAGLQTEALELSNSLATMRQATTEAVAPLRAAAGDLAKAGASGEKIGSSLAGVVQQIAPLTETLGGTLRQLGELERRIATLVQGLDSALKGFSGLDGSLAGVFGDLRKGLAGFAEQVSKFVNDTNKDMAQAVTQLSGAVEELGIVLENGDPRRTAGRN